MGAKMTPITKNRGSTVFGVKMGLEYKLAVASIPTSLMQHLLPCFQTLLPERGVYNAISPRSLVRAIVSSRSRLLGGLLLLVFFGSSRAGSWLDIESVCSTCCVCDMVSVFRANPRFRGWKGRGGRRLLER